MLKTKFQTLAQVVGYVTIGLLAVYGLLTLAGGGSALASVSAALGTASGQSAAAAIPSTFNYQGLLRNPDGSLTTGSYTITARIYDVAASGSALYTETFPSVTVRDGLFNMVLGDNPQGQNLTSEFAEMPRYIGIQLDDAAELIPRQRLHGVPWALYATNAMTATTLVPNATINGLNGLAVNGSISASENLTVTGDISVGENLTVTGDVAAQNVTASGNVTVTGKVTSAATTSGDSSTTVTTKGYVDAKWPDGSYCIMRKGPGCPAGFAWGEIGFDTEDDYPANYLNGTVGEVWDYGHRSSWAVAVCCK
jgi:C-terminal domain of apextrin